MEQENFAYGIRRVKLIWPWLKEKGAAAVAALEKMAAVTMEVERHINNIEESLAMRRARKGARRESHTKHIALDVVQNSREKSSTQATSSGIDDRDEDSIESVVTKGGKRFLLRVMMLS